VGINNLIKKGESLMEISKVFNIPIQSDEQCKKFNTSYKTEFKSMEDHIDKTIKELYKMIETVCDDGGWYTADSLEIEIRVKYCPENK